MTVITISRQLGSRGEEVAAEVAQVLKLRLIDAETINKAAEKAGVPSMALQEMEREGERGLANQVLKALRTMPSLRTSAAYPAELDGGVEMSYAESPRFPNPFSGLFSPMVPPISASLEGYVHMIGLVIRGLAHEGNVLIVGRGGQVLLKNHPGALHLQIVAPLAPRVQVVMERAKLDQRSAQNRVRANDRSRFDYIRRYYGVDWLDPTLYHLTINSSQVPLPTAVDLIIAAQKAVALPDAEGKE